MLPTTLQLARRQTGGPSSLQAKGSAAFQELLIIEAKALTVPIQKLEPISPAAARKRRPHRPRLLAQGHPGQRSRPAMPLRMSVTPQQRNRERQVPRPIILLSHSTD